MNYFEFYGLPMAFYIDENALRQQFITFSREFHPDFYTLDDEAKRQEMLEKSVLNNKAYNTLRAFDTRLAYILELKGAAVGENDQEKMPAAFLGEMMELNEQLMELEFDFDANVLARVQNDLKIKQEEALTTVEPVLRAFDAQTTGEEDLKKIQLFYKKMKYFLRISKTLSTFATAK